MEPVTIVFDMGGTTTRVAAARGGVPSSVETFRTREDPKEGVALLIHTIRTVAGASAIRTICGGVKGVVKDGVIHNPPHIPRWDGVPLAALLAREFSAPVTLMNDTELVALGEYAHGAGKGERSMLYVTVSTGVGGAMIVDGTVQKGVYNAEIGHQNVDGEELEAQVSGTAVQKKYGVHPKDFDDPQALNALADILAKGLFDSILHWSPEVVVLGGSMIVGTNPIPLTRVKETLTKLVKSRYPEAPRVLKATLGDQGGLWGGLAHCSGFKGVHRPKRA